VINLDDVCLSQLVTYHRYCEGGESGLIIQVEIEAAQLLELSYALGMIELDDLSELETIKVSNMLGVQGGFSQKKIVCFDFKIGELIALLSISDLDLSAPNPIIVPPPIFSHVNSVEIYTRLVSRFLVPLIEKNREKIENWLKPMQFIHLNLDQITRMIYCKLRDGAYKFDVICNQTLLHDVITEITTIIGKFETEMENQQDTSQIVDTQYMVDELKNFLAWFGEYIIHSSISIAFDPVHLIYLFECSNLAEDIAIGEIGSMVLQHHELTNCAKLLYFILCQHADYITQICICA
jgi:hypothetical protein